MLLAVSEQNMQLETALSECWREYNILIDAILNSQKGIQQPHIITPAQIVKQMKASQADIPSELTLPIPLSATYQNLNAYIFDLDVLIRNNFLVYVIRLPLTNHVRYNIPRSPVTHSDKGYRYPVYLHPAGTYLFMDIARRYYARLWVTEIKELKLITSRQSLQTK